jgi:hypothetical protein
MTPSSFLLLDANIVIQWVRAVVRELRTVLVRAPRSGISDGHDSGRARLSLRRPIPATLRRRELR